MADMVSAALPADLGIVVGLTDRVPFGMRVFGAHRASFWCLPVQGRAVVLSANEGKNNVMGNTVTCTLN